ncbi:unnamed protein product [Meloidogyne enterolobii]|uniref:Uncharacterized protein n=1 Tax=Meloidogyne enterolobii TaxID=390850 RepID=A0ACB0Z2A2_MELEN
MRLWSKSFFLLKFSFVLLLILLQPGQVNPNKKAKPKAPIKPVIAEKTTTTVNGTSAAQNVTTETTGNTTNTNLNITTTSTTKMESTLNSTTTQVKKETTGLPTQKPTKKITLTTNTTKGITKVTTTDTNKTTKNSPKEEKNSLKYIIIVVVILVILGFCFCCCYCCWEDLKSLPCISRLRKSKKLKIIRKQTFSDEDRDITFVYFKGEDFAIKEEPIIIKKQIKLPEEETLNEEIENTKGLKVNFTNELLVVYEVGSELDMVVDSEGKKVEYSPPNSWKNTYQGKIKRGNYESYTEKKREKTESEESNDTMSVEFDDKSVEFETDKSLSDLEYQKKDNPKGAKKGDKKGTKMKKMEKELKKKKEGGNNNKSVEIKEDKTTKATEILLKDVNIKDTQREMNEANIVDNTTEATSEDLKIDETNEGGEDENGGEEGVVESNYIT